MKITALATCHDRRDLTLRALGSLCRQSLPDVSELSICLVDDGSSDGTTEAIRTEFPKVTLIEGTGDLFWAGGMRYGWEQFVRQQTFDYLLVFNDDVDLYPDALETVITAARSLESEGCTALAVAGALKNPDTGETSYGGVVRKSWWHPLRFKKIPPTSVPQACSTVNMNFTLISRAALDLIGFLSPEFVHKTADYDFGLRLCKAGGKIVLAPGYVGNCVTNPVTGTLNEPGISFRERIRRLNSIKGQPAQLRVIYYRRHAGRLWPFYWALTYLRIFFESSLHSIKSPGVSRKVR